MAPKRLGVEEPSMSLATFCLPISYLIAKYDRIYSTDSEDFPSNLESSLTGQDRPTAGIEAYKNANSIKQ